MLSETVELKRLLKIILTCYISNSYDSDYKRSKFKTTNTKHAEMNRTAKRQMYKSPKRNHISKEERSTYAKQKGINS